LSSTENLTLMNLEYNLKYYYLIQYH
jgi:hypothetical protein